MIRIDRAFENDNILLSQLSKQTLLESHANSPAAAGLPAYVEKNYNEAVLHTELKDQNNIYHIIYYNKQPAGYSKIIFNMPFTGSKIINIAKLERFYLLKEFYGLTLGQQLFDLNIELARKNRQSGIWLYTWQGNQRAIQFYKKNGFIINGSYDFKITEDLINPNHRLFLKL